MVKQTATVTINPDVLRWVIEGGGWDIEELAKKLNVKPATIELWQKSRVMDIVKLEKLAEYAKRPLAIFFLSKPPTEIELPDYRKLAGFHTEKMSKKTIFAIRESRYLQSVAKDLLESQGISLQPNVNVVNLNDDPEKVAAKERKKLGFESEEGLNSKEATASLRGFYNKLRATIESFNIFVFQMNMPLNEARGFSLPDDLPRCIVVNSTDSERPKIFTLLHEYGHILLRKEGICLPGSDIYNNSKNNLNKIEWWCNQFAGSILMPTDPFLKEISYLESRFSDPKRILENLSSKFKASKKAVIVRITNLTPTSRYIQFYEDTYEEIKNQEEVSPSKKKGIGGPHPVDKCLSRKGRKFVSLVLDSKDKQIVNYNEMIDYLDLNIKYIGKLQEKL